MPTSRELVAELRGMGVSQRAIGQAISRNDSLISQIARGAKPGNNLTGALTELRDRLAGGASVREVRVAEPARRTTLAGRAARVRKPTTIRGASWSSATIKRQATRSGGNALLHPLGDAAAAGHHVAVTASVAKGTQIIATSGSKKRGAHDVTIDLGDADELADELEASGLDFSDYVAERMADAGLISYGGDSADALDSIELRAY